MKKPCQLAQVNIARTRAPLDDPLMASFVARLNEINALAESSEGFVWRLKTDEGNATSLQPYADERIIVNLSVWQSPEHLQQFVYRSMHAKVMRERRQWFERMETPFVALWWVRHGHTPTVEEAKERLQYLTLHGDSDFAFGFSKLVAAPGSKPVTAAA